MEDAIATYRNTFRPSQFLDAPYFMLAANVFAADTDEQAQYIRTSQQQAFANLRSGKPGRLPRPVRNIEEIIAAPYLAGAEEALSVAATGSPASVRQQLGALLDRYRPDEIMVTGMIHDHEARKRSFAIAAEALAEVSAVPA